jgi:protein SCO1
MKFPRSHSISQLWVAVGLFLVWATVLTACSGTGSAKPKVYAWDIAGVMPALDFTLMSEYGTRMTADNLRGKTVLLYFGYATCPDVCPTTLTTLSGALKRLGRAGQSVRVLFVSVDPRRDSPRKLRDYVAAFGPQFVGLTGTDDELTALAKRYRVAYRREAPDANGNYAVYHSSAVFVFDRSGRARLLVTPSEPDEQLARDLSALM